MPTYRIRFRREDGADALEVIDEERGAPVCVCRLPERPALSTLTIEGPDGVWRSTPSRRVMPTRWSITKDGDTVFQLDSGVAGKLLNPLHRTSVVVLHADGTEIFRVIDARSSVADRLIGSGPNDWTLMAGDRAVGRLGTLPRAVPRDGVLGRLRSALAGYDFALISLGSDHLLPAPAALFLLAIHNTLTDTSSG